MLARTPSFLLAVSLLYLVGSGTIRAEPVEPPSRPAVDSPELSQPGGFAVGVRTITLLGREPSAPTPTAATP